MKRFKSLIIGSFVAALLVFTFVQTTVFANGNKDSSAPTKEKKGWVTTWNASPEPTWGADIPLPTKLPAKIENQTIRQVAKISLGGNQIRISFSNEYGKEPLTIGEAHVALTDNGSNIVKNTDRKLTFGGKTSVVIPAGASIVSDSVPFKVNAQTKVSISLYLPKTTTPTTFHWDARQTTYIGKGNVSSATRMKADSTTDASMYVTGISVHAPTNNGTVVAIGDSITDGDGATVDADTRWTNFLAERLVSQKVSVINAGISGNRLLRDGMGVSVLSRFNRDVLSQPNVKSVIVLIGINDISWPGTGFAPTETRPKFDELVAGYRQLIAQAHARHIKVIGLTLTPFEGALSGTNLDNYYSKDKEELRQKVNSWIRSGEFDSVVDLDAIMKDPEHPTRLLAKYDSGDHLHPGDVGNKVIADSMDLNAIIK
ncbi:SGNH/GDSL hydrolase family protein [Bacillus clarus]|uniref:GDSL-like Lipase/Acylhydrolase family protein n=1 Tax=Bacillus clarus TaxID=2338372 RepID=A0A090Z018_9BACI|nr:SGNH/GDSL hydrolase family protein [Bacillus clarus]KFN04559.1 GDSL-like Lipase/Acylhydrolase family protein [Bacillus clarus]RFT64906.1 SGNH/GDSL hydrolase family protein [Bacillus clarus]